MAELKSIDFDFLRDIIQEPRSLAPSQALRDALAATIGAGDFVEQAKKDFYNNLELISEALLFSTASFMAFKYDPDYHVLVRVLTERKAELSTTHVARLQAGFEQATGMERANIPAAEAPAATLNDQREILGQLMQSQEFAVDVAAWQDGAYYRGIGQTPPAFNDNTVTKPVSQNVAMNLAGFYAVEAGIGAIADRTGQSPAEILKGIVDGTLPEADMLLLARFANATWKAGQPFRSLDRIGRSAFVPAQSLPAAELEKDYVQLKGVAELLLPRVEAGANADAQRDILKALLQDKDFATTMAEWMDGAYYRGQGQTPPPFNSAPVEVTMRENVAMNLAGFYAVECGVGYLAETTGQNPYDILKQIKDGTLPETDMLLLARFANATWKAGQPFRSMDRITRDNFIPAALLSDAELAKDFAQIKAAATIMVNGMERVAQERGLTIEITPRTEIIYEPVSAPPTTNPAAEVRETRLTDLYRTYYISTSSESKELLKDALEAKARSEGMDVDTYLETRGAELARELGIAETDYFDAISKMRIGGVLPKTPEMLARERAEVEIKERERK
ncbi:hypothetical protein K1X76_12845 [bacterium]|nr:hypothetical protein [bacterium]